MASRIRGARAHAAGGCPGRAGAPSRRRPMGDQHASAFRPRRGDRCRDASGRAGARVSQGPPRGPEEGASTSPGTPTSAPQRGYVPHNFADVPFQLIDGEQEILPGIRGIPTPGHVPYHQSILVESGGERACFIADLVPTSAHLPLPWIMGYDVQPLVTLETRRRLYERAEAEQWLLVFDGPTADQRSIRRMAGLRPCPTTGARLV